MSFESEQVAVLIGRDRFDRLSPRLAAGTVIHTYCSRRCVSVVPVDDSPWSDDFADPF